MDNINKTPIDGVTDDVAQMKKEVKRINLFMIGVVIVLLSAFAAIFLAVGGLITIYISEKQTSYEQLTNQVQSQNEKIDILVSEIAQSKNLPSASK